MNRRLATAALTATFCAIAPLTATAAHAATKPYAPHRIKASKTALYDTVTKAAFTPRGANYVRLTAAHGGAYHSTFEPGRYSARDAQAVLDGMKKASGYNTVRVFIDPGDGHFDHGLDTRPGKDGLNQKYMDNVADLLDELRPRQGLPVPGQASIDRQMEQERLRRHSRLPAGRRLLAVR